MRKDCRGLEAGGTGTESAIRSFEDGIAAERMSTENVLRKLDCSPERTSLKWTRRNVSVPVICMPA